MLMNVLYAGIGAGIIALGGYLKNTSQETFEWKKALKTLLLTIGLSVGASLTGLTPDVFSSTMLGMALDQILENLLKAIFRKESALRVVVSK